MTQDERKPYRKSSLDTLIDRLDEMYIKKWLEGSRVGGARPDSSQNYSANAKAEELRPVGKIVTV